MNKKPRKPKLATKGLDVSFLEERYKYSDYQIEHLPIRDLSWFENGGFKLTCLAYCKGMQCSKVGTHSLDHADHLFSLQEAGYRFIKAWQLFEIFEFSEWYLYGKHHPKCDNCTRQMSCTRIGGDGKYTDYIIARDNCFEKKPENFIQPELIRMPYYFSN